MWGVPSFVLSPCITCLELKDAFCWQNGIDERDRRHEVVCRELEVAKERLKQIDGVKVRYTRYFMAYASATY